MRFVSLICCLLLIASSASHGQRLKNSQFLKEVYKLSPAIYDVKGMGNWKKGKQAGQIRLVLARSARQDEVFLQWVSWGKKGPESVVSTVQVTEIAKKARFKVSFIRREASDGNRNIVLGLENLYDKSAARAVIEVRGVGVYHCKIE